MWNIEPYRLNPGYHGKKSVLITTKAVINLKGNDDLLSPPWTLFENVSPSTIKKCENYIIFVMVEIEKWTCTWTYPHLVCQGI